MRTLLLIIGATLLLAVLALAGTWYYACRIAEPEWVTGVADRGPIKKIVSSTGTLKAINVVEIGCQISGIIASLPVDFNDAVASGQVLALLDPTIFAAQVLQAEADLEGSVLAERNLHAKLVSLRGNMATADADEEIQATQVRRAEITLTSAKRSLERLSAIYAKKLIPKADVDDAESQVDAAQAGLDAAQAQTKSLAARSRTAAAQIGSFEAEKEGAAAQIRQRRAQLEIARANLAQTRITSPIAGVVLSRKVVVGQTVSANTQAPDLFTIARDLRLMEIETLVDESDICHLREGQPATFTVDPYPGRKFSAVVRQVRIAPQTENAVMYPVILAVDNPDLALKPGLSANVEIQVEHRENVVRIPTDAMFFLPPKDVLKRFPAPDKDREDESATEPMTIWILDSGRVRPVMTVPGLSNARFTEVDHPDIGSGTLVVRYKKEWWMDFFPGSR